jgi:hypothetical protein
LYLDLHCLFLAGLPLRGAHEFKWQLEAYDSTLTLLEFVVSFINQYAPLFMPNPSPCFSPFLLLLLILNIDGDTKKKKRSAALESPFVALYELSPYPLALYPSQIFSLSICSNQRQMVAKNEYKK